MSMLDGHDAIMRRIADMPDAPHLVWPDDSSGAQDFNTRHPRPRFVMQTAGGAQSTDAVDEATTDATPEVVVRVETRSGGNALDNSALVRALVSHFPAGLRFDGLTIMEAPQVGPPIPGTDTYAVPVTIRARMQF